MAKWKPKLKRPGKMNLHHIRAQARDRSEGFEGDKNERNIVYICMEAHEALHSLFGILKLHEIRLALLILIRSNRCWSKCEWHELQNAIMKGRIQEIPAGKRDDWDVPNVEELFDDLRYCEKFTFLFGGLALPNIIRFLHTVLVPYTEWPPEEIAALRRELENQQLRQDAA